MTKDELQSVLRECKNEDKRDIVIKYVDECRKANMRSLENIRIVLNGADLRGAKVENARFGNNPGIDEDAKLELKQRGAIFEDSPGERSKIPTR